LLQVRRPHSTPYAWREINLLVPAMPAEVTQDHEAGFAPALADSLQRLAKNAHPNSNSSTRSGGTNLARSFKAGIG